jgi:hypothetical protein
MLNSELTLTSIQNSRETPRVVVDATRYRPHRIAYLVSIYGRYIDLPRIDILVRSIHTHLQYKRYVSTVSDTYRRRVCIDRIRCGQYIHCGKNMLENSTRRVTRGRAPRLQVDSNQIARGSSGSVHRGLGRFVALYHRASTLYQIC